MELSDLTTFAAVARCGGITRAAQELHTVQSNVTARIRALEADVGTPLFERHSRGVSLTSAGQRLLPYVDRLSALLHEARQAAGDDGVARGPLAIGSMETTAAVRLPGLLARFHADCPQVQLSLRTGPTAELLAAVLAHALDGAFVAGPVDHPELQVLPVFDEELMLITAAHWSRLDALKDALAHTGQPLSALTFREGCSYRRRLDQVLAAQGWPAFTRLEFGTLEGILGCVGAGVGLTLLPRSVVEASAHRAHLALHALPRAMARTATVFVTRRQAHASTALQRFVQGLQAPRAAPVRRRTAAAGHRVRPAR